MTQSTVLQYEAPCKYSVLRTQNVWLIYIQGLYMHWTGANLLLQDISIAVDHRFASALAPSQMTTATA